MSDDITVRYWAAAKAAAGRADEAFPVVATLADLLDEVRARYGAGSPLDVVLARCSYLVDEVSPGTRRPAEIVLGRGCVVDVLPPFAGGSDGCGGTPDAGPWLAWS